MRRAAPRRWRVGVAVTLLSILAVGVPAFADHQLIPDPNWPTLLPGRDVPAQSDPPDPCRKSGAGCSDETIRAFYANWAPLDETCSHRAVWALAHLRHVEAFRATLLSHEFEDEEWLKDLAKFFDDMFLEAIDAYARGSAPAAWQVAYQAADRATTSGVQDIFLGMNAHIQRDLPFAVFRMGLVGSQGRSHKPDYDFLNGFIATTLDSVEDELAARYDPTIKLADASPSPVDEVTAIQLIKIWRETAWRNAERLAAASPTEFPAVARSIETYAEGWARFIAAPDFSAYAPARWSYCQAAKSRPSGAQRLDSVPWPNLLPGRGVPPASAPAAGCGPNEAECLSGVIAAMRANWEPLDRSCSHRAVWALVYLRITEAIYDNLRQVPGGFRDRQWLADLAKVFSDMFFAAIEQYKAGTAPASWKVTYDAQDARRTNGGQDFLLALNAHVQRDLPFALQRVGLVDAWGVSHKPDFDAFNELTANVFMAVKDELAQRYDPLFGLAELEPYPVAETGMLETIKAWRELAWRNGESLAQASTPQEFQAKAMLIESHAEGWGRVIAAPDFSAYAPTRLAHCQAPL